MVKPLKISLHLGCLDLTEFRAWGLGLRFSSDCGVPQGQHGNVMRITHEDATGLDIPIKGKKGSQATQQAKERNSYDSGFRV